MDDAPLTFTVVNGVVITTISFVCNPVSVVPQEPFVYESTAKYECTRGSGGQCTEWSPTTTSASITVYTSLVCAKGGTELREYQKRADRQRHGN